MRSQIVIAVCCSWALVQTISADVITPTGVSATSQFGAVDVFSDGNFSAVFVDSLINGSGLDGIGDILLQQHDNDGNATTMWHAGCFDAGIPGGVPATCAEPDMLVEDPIVAQQIVEFDLGDLFDLDAAHIWQMNQGGAFGALAPERGVNEFEILISASADGDDFSSLGTFNLEVEPGTATASAQEFVLNEATGVRRVRLDINTRYGTEPLETGFVGLSEVRFEGTLSDGFTPGDFNKDGNVDGDDFLKWQASFPTAAGATQADGDADGDEDVDGDDFLAWQANFGSGGGAAGNAIPEPGTVALVLMFLAPLAGVRVGR